MGKRSVPIFPGKKKKKKKKSRGRGEQAPLTEKRVAVLTKSSPCKMGGEGGKRGGSGGGEKKDPAEKIKFGCLLPLVQGYKSQTEGGGVVRKWGTCDQKNGSPHDA